MANCSVCGFATRNDRNIYTDSIGRPPEDRTISELLLECIAETNFQIEDGGICRKCNDKLVKYHKASLIIKRIKAEFHDILCSLDVNKGNSGNDSTSQEIYFEEISASEELEQAFEIEETLDVGLCCDELETSLKVDEDVEQDESYAEDYSLQKEDHSDALDIDTQMYNEQISVSYDDNNEFSNESPSSANENAIDESSQELYTQKSSEEYSEHTKERHYICDKCGKTYLTHQGFVAHRKGHGPHRYHCSICGKSFKFSVLLQRHLAGHSGEKPYECEICAKRFAVKYYLLKHMLIHDESNRRVECQICGFKFLSRHHLSRHMVTHTGEKPHNCPVCGKGFTQACNMKIHLKEHEQPGSTRRQRRFKCTKCELVFTKKQDFQQHEKEGCEN